MCLRPRKILNPKRQFSQVGGHPLFIEVGCGKCAECQKRKVREYQLRSYYEAYTTFKEGGFILNDTLTYDDAHVPHLRDFDPSVAGTAYDIFRFNREDIRLFMVRLRRALVRAGYKNIVIKYFLASEYGTSIGFTHRPHYHILFFVYGDIAPLVFSRFVSSCWTLGRTDGAKWKGDLYVLNNRVFSRSSNNDLYHLQNVVMYVSKYLTKDSWYSERIERSINKLVVERYGLESSHEAKKYRLELKRQLSQFHLNSHHYGESALRYHSLDEIMETGVLRLPCSDSVIQHIPIPVYLSRKLFYELGKDFRGKPQWRLTNLGIQYRLGRNDSSVDFLTCAFDSWYKSLPLTHPSDYQSIRDRVRDLQDNRPFRDFAKYILFYRNRILPINEHEKIRCGHPLPLPSPPPSLELMTSLPYEHDYFAYLYNDSRDPIPYPSVSFTWYGDKDSPLPVYGLPNTQPIKEYAMRWTITESTYYEFRNYDKLYNLYIGTLASINQIKQNAFEKNLTLKELYKTLKSNNLTLSKKY